MKEIGGYFQLEHGSNLHFHKGVVKLNSARNALRCIVRSLRIKYIYVPYYTCPVVWDVLREEKCEILPYDLDDNFMPLLASSEIPLLYTNYFGLTSKNIEKIKKKFLKIIIDNAQAFYASPEGVACFWSPRKFFGLPDGGVMWPKFDFAEKLPLSESWYRCSHLLKRWDKGANAAYEDFQQNEASLDKEIPMGMSRLTSAMMSILDYKKIAHLRLRNFTILHKELGHENLLQIDIEDEILSGSVPMVYPFQCKDENLRKYLIKNKIYVAKYWPQKKGCECMHSSSAKKLANEILPLPIDQRYNEKDMMHIVEVIHG